jgi:acyl-CoA thioesterase-2
MPFDITTFDALMSLEAVGGDTYRGVGPAYPWGRVYGGQVVAQGLRAAMLTVADEYRVHSLHAYFIRGGDFDEPILFDVDRIRDGRSFTTRRVVARQAVGPILNMSASFQLREEQADVQERAVPAGIRGPEELREDIWGEILDRRIVPVEAPRAAAWLRVVGMSNEDPGIQACALAYASDDMPTEAASLSHPRNREMSEIVAYSDHFVGASLDHAIWFHREGRHDEWVLHDFYGQGVNGARALGLGQVYARDGTHLATVAQEILIRERTR